MPVAVKTSTLSRSLNRFKHIPGMCWAPLVIVRAPPSHDECDNPDCDQFVELKQAHLVNGNIVIVNVCWPCGEIVSRETGMGPLPTRAVQVSA